MGTLLVSIVGGAAAAAASAAAAYRAAKGMNKLDPEGQRIFGIFWLSAIGILCVAVIAGIVAYKTSPRFRRWFDGG